jgi:hypothetical protein
VSAAPQRLSLVRANSTTLTLNTKSTYDWRGEDWTVPINLLVSHIYNFGKQSVGLAVGGRYYVETPREGPN